METKRGEKILTDDLELHIIEIPKAEEILKKDKENRIAQWLVFLKNPNTERVEEIMKENEEVKKAGEVLYEMSGDEELQRLAELREKWDLDERSALASAKEDGEAIGREEGKQEEKIEMARKMKLRGDTIEDIIEITGLAKEEVEKL